MKKKILFMIINMNIGGTERALLNMLCEMDKEKYDVTVLMLEEYGGLLGDIPDWINIKYVKGYESIKDILNLPPKIVVKKLINQGKTIKAFNIAILHLLSKIKKENSMLFKYVLKDYNILEEEFDISVAYAGPMDFISYFIVNKIKSKKKVQWIHFDVTKINFNVAFANKVYAKFDKIYIVSDEAKIKLQNIIPNLKNKIETFYNVISPNSIIKMANESSGFIDEFSGMRILTVGRLAKEKGQDLIIPVLAKLKEEGYNLRWYCIGDGNLRSECEELIKKYKLDQDFILLGSNSNPYRYMKDCDIYVQPSRYEGYCTTTMEAKCLKKPILTTDVNGMKEQIKNNINGLIVGISSEDIYIGLKKMLDDKTIIKQFIHELELEDINEPNKFNNLFYTL